MELLKLLSSNEIIAQVLGFLVLLTLLRVFAWRKILGLLDKRKEHIALQLKRIEESKADIERTKLEYAAKLKSIEQEARQKIHEALNASKAIFEEARKNGHIQAQEIIDNAKKSVKFELARARDELKDEIIELTLKATESLIQEKLTGEGDRRLVRLFLEEVEKIE